MENYGMRHYWAAVSLYTTGLALIYTYTYWGRFGINAFSFMGISEIVTSSAYALIAVITAFLGVGVVATILHRLDQSTKFSDELESRFGKNRSQELWIAVGIIFVGIALWGIRERLDGAVVVIFVGTVVAILFRDFVAQLSFITRLPFPEWFHRTLSGFIIVLPFMVQYAALDSSNQVISGIQPFSVVADTECKDRYVGKAGGFHFFYDSELKELRIEQIEAIPQIRLLSGKSARAQCQKTEEQQ